MLKHVLVPLDGTPVTEKAITYATRILEPSGKLTLVMAIDIAERAPFGLPQFPPARASAGKYRDAVDRLLPQAYEYLERQRVNLQSGTQVTIEFHAEICDAAAFILRLAQECEVDAIIMCAPQRAEFRRWLSTNVMERVVRGASCPVVVLPPNPMERTS